MGTTSDHAGLFVKLTRTDRGTTPFKFFNSWLRDNQFNAAFKEAWEERVDGSPQYILQQQINAVRRVGKDWAKKKKITDETSRKIVAELQAAATEWQANPHNQDTQNACRNLKLKLIECQHREQLDLQQRVHISWITQGDQVSKFFAQAIKARHAKNSIMGTLDAEGRQTNCLEEMK